MAATKPTMRVLAQPAPCVYRSRAGLATMAALFEAPASALSTADLVRSLRVTVVAEDGAPLETLHSPQQDARARSGALHFAHSVAGSRAPSSPRILSRATVVAHRTRAGAVRFWCNLTANRNGRAATPALRLRASLALRDVDESATQAETRSVQLRSKVGAGRIERVGGEAVLEHTETLYAQLLQRDADRVLDDDVPGAEAGELIGALESKLNALGGACRRRKKRRKQTRTWQSSYSNDDDDDEEEDEEEEDDDEGEELRYSPRPQSKRRRASLQSVYSMLPASALLGLEPDGMSPTDASDLVMDMSPLSKTLTPSLLPMHDDDIFDTLDELLLQGL